MTREFVSTCCGVSNSEPTAMISAVATCAICLGHGATGDIHIHSVKRVVGGKDERARRRKSQADDSGAGKELLRFSRFIDPDNPAATG